MKRRLLNVAIAISLLLSLALAVLWIRSYHRYDRANVSHVRRPQPDDHRSIYVAATSYRGTLNLTLRHRTVDLRGFSAEARRTYPDPGLHWQIGADAGILWGSPPPIGFRARHYLDTGPAYRAHSWALGLRHWLPLALTLVVPAISLLRFAHSRRAARRGLCPSCGYDLRATPDRCPECGSAIQFAAHTLQLR